MLRLAHEEARELRHSYVGTEHILLALLREDEATAASVLKSMGVTYEQVRSAVIRMLGVGPDPDPDPGAAEPVFTGPAEEALELARHEASQRGEGKAGTEHILRALVQERNGAAVRILLGLDADPDAIRAALPS